MIHFISGKPRAGKSLYAVRLVVDELLYGSRPIVTNLPLNMGALSAYLQSKYPDRQIDLLTRVRLLDDEETKVFWCYRPGWQRLKPISKEDWKRGVRPDYSEVADKPGGVFFAIDEIHTCFNARDWQDTGRDCLFYLSQHAKLGDTLLAITQAIGNVDSQFRSVAQDFTFLRNFAKEKMGFFKLPGVFMRQTFATPPTELSRPMETGTFRLDTSGLAGCYNTAAGVGIHSRFADKNERIKGLDWRVGVVCLIALLLVIFAGGPKAIAGLFMVKLPPPKVYQQQKPQGTSSSDAHQTLIAPSEIRGSVTEKTNRVTGFSEFGGKKYFTTSDGHITVVNPDGSKEVW